MVDCSVELAKVPSSFQGLDASYMTQTQRSGPSLQQLKEINRIELAE